jgi:hypothetical protein
MILAIMIIATPTSTPYVLLGTARDIPLGHITLGEHLRIAHATPTSSAVPTYARMRIYVVRHGAVTA